MQAEPIHDRWARSRTAPASAPDARVVRVRGGRFVLALWLLATATTTACGADARASTTIEEADFLDVVLDAAHPAMVATDEVLAEAIEERRSAGLWPNPTLAFELEAPDGEAEQTTYKLEWTPPLDGRRGLGVDAAEASLAAARARRAWNRASLRAEARERFADWSCAVRREALLAEHVQTLRTLHERLQRRAGEGEESRLSAQRFELAMAAVRVDWAKARAIVVDRRASVMVLHPELDENVLPVLPALPEVDAVEATGPRADALAFAEQARAADLRARRAGRWLRFPTLVVGWTRLSFEGDAATGPFAGLAWDLPLFDRDQGARAGAALEMAAARARATLAERESERRRRGAIEAYATLQATARELAVVAAGAADVETAASASFLAGESTTTDLLETLRTALEARLAALEIHEHALAAHRELELQTTTAFPGGDDR